MVGNDKDFHTKKCYTGQSNSWGFMVCQTPAEEGIQGVFRPVFSEVLCSNAIIVLLFFLAALPGRVEDGLKGGLMEWNFTGFTPF